MSESPGRRRLRMLWAEIKLDMRINPDSYEMAKQQEEEFHAAVAERRLEEEGIKPELNLYLIGIGGMAR
jgi:hypothetical protein